jgi:cytochrome c553
MMGFVQVRKADAVFRSVILAGALAVSTGAVAGDSVQWAYPGLGRPSGHGAPASGTVTVPGSAQRYPASQVDDFFIGVDWFPQRHAAMPLVVAHGRRPNVYACGYCHLPQGEGRPENATLAGLSASYISTQLRNIGDGERASFDSSYKPAGSMRATAAALTASEIAQVASYFSQQAFTKRLGVLETATIPAVMELGFVYQTVPGNTGDLGERIVEVPDNSELFEHRDPDVTYTAYVPPGAIERGQNLATSADQNAVTSCTTCHGAGLRGTAVAPPLAGRSPTATMRELLAFRGGTRNAPEDAPMVAETASLSTRDLIDLAAYIGSLQP